MNKYTHWMYMCVFTYVCVIREIEIQWKHVQNMIHINSRTFYQNRLYFFPFSFRWALVLNFWVDYSLSRRRCYCLTLESIKQSQTHTHTHTDIFLLLMTMIIIVHLQHTFRQIERSWTWQLSNLLRKLNLIGSNQKWEILNGYNRLLNYLLNFF